MGEIVPFKKHESTVVTKEITGPEFLICTCHEKEAPFGFVVTARKVDRNIFICSLICSYCGREIPLANGKIIE